MASKELYNTISVWMHFYNFCLVVVSCITLYVVCVPYARMVYVMCMHCNSVYVERDELVQWVPGGICQYRQLVRFQCNSTWWQRSPNLCYHKKQVLRALRPRSFREKTPQMFRPTLLTEYVTVFSGRTDTPEAKCDLTDRQTDTDTHTHTHTHTQTNNYSNPHVLDIYAGKRGQKLEGQHSKSSGVLKLWQKLLL